MQADCELIEAVLEGQKEAFAELVSRYERPVRAITLNILSDHHSMEDVVQDTFIAAYKNLPMLRNRNAFGTWLMKIAYRCSLDWLNRRQKTNLLEINSAAADEPPDGQLNEDNEALLSAVIKLPEVERQVITLRYFSSYSVGEVAQAVGRNIGTVTKQLSRAHKRLKKILKEF